MAIKRGSVNKASDALFEAIYEGNVRAAKKALAAGADVNGGSKVFDETPLTAAAREGNLELVKLLIANGADVDKKFDGNTPVFCAVYGNSLEVLKALVEAGAKVKVSRYGEMVLMQAAENGALEVAKFLVERGVDPHAVNSDRGMTALDYARSGKSAEHQAVAKWLESLGVESLRVEPRAVAVAIGKRYGGKPVQHIAGFMLNTKMGGHFSQASTHAMGGHVAVFRFRLRAPELRTLGEASLVFAPDKPDRTRGVMRELRGVAKKIGLRVWLEGSGEVSQQFVARYFARDKARLNALRLVRDEHFVVGGRGISVKWIGNDVQSVMSRLKVFEELVESLCEKPQPEKRLLEKEWLLKRASKSEAKNARHQFGGTIATAVACPDCGSATNLMASVNFSDPKLPKTMLGRRKLPVSWCLSCAEWGPSFYEMSADALKPLNKDGKPIAARKVEKGEKDLPMAAAILAPIAKGGRKSRLGGKPAWIQGEETPDCPRCKTAMSFALQLASDRGISYGDVGILYAFVCGDCEVMATLVQSH
jgi:hypothetical protein